MGGGVTNIFYWSSAFRICTGCLPKYDWNLFKIGFKNTNFQIFQEFPALKETVAHFQPNGQFVQEYNAIYENGSDNYFIEDDIDGVKLILI